MGKGSKARWANGIVSAIIAVLFLAHALLGSAAMAFGYVSPFAWVVWIGVGLIVLHVLLSVATSREQLVDQARPPSARKKRHLALKWVTGAILAVAAIVHVALPKSTLAASLLMLVVVVALAVHVCVSAKSLLTDIGIDKRYKMLVRIIVCALLAVAAMVTLTCLFMQ